MSEETLGFAKLLLSADSSELKKGIEEAKSHARSMGKTMGEVADEVGGKGKKLLMAQDRYDRAMVAMTGTASQQAVAALEARYSKEIILAKRAGIDTTAMAREFAAQKKQILLDAVSDEVRGSNVLIDSHKKLGMSKVALTEKTKMTGESMKGLKAAMGLAGIEGTKFGQTLNLASSGFTPLTAGLGIATGLIFAYTEHIKNAQKETEAFLAVATGNQLQLKELQIDADAKAGRGGDPELMKLQARLASKEREVEEASRVMRESEARGLSQLARGLQTDEGALGAKIGSQGLIPEAVSKGVGEFIEGLGSGPAKKVAALAEEARKLRAQMELLKKERGETADAAPAEDFKAWSDAEFARMAKYRTELAAVSTSTEPVAAGLEKVETTSESFADSTSSDLEDAGEAAEEYADQTIAALDRVDKRLKKTGSGFSGTKSGSIFGGMGQRSLGFDAVASGIVTAKEARAVANDLYKSGMKQNEIDEELLRRGIDPSKARGRGGGGMGMAAGDAFKAVYGAAPGTYSHEVISRFTSGQYAPAPKNLQVTIKHQVDGGGGRFDEAFLSAAEEDIRRGGSLSRVIEEYFNVQRSAR